MVTVHIPALLRDLTAGAASVQVAVPAGERITIRQLLERLDALHPGLLDALLYRDDLLPGIAVFIDSDQALMRLQAKVGADSEVHFLPPVVGGG
jgi:molybdopterin converting factor small subunit